MNTSDSAVFPAGFVTRHTTDDFDVMARSLPAWRQEYRKVQPGRFQGRLSMLHTGHLQSSEQYFNCGMALAGRAPQRCWSFALATEGCAHARLRGAALRDDTLYVIRADEDVDWISTGPLRWMFVSIEATRLETYARVHRCDFPWTRASAGRLTLDNGGGVRLAACWRELNRLTMNWPECLTDPLRAAQVEAAFLSAISIIATPHDPRPRVSQRTRIARSARDFLHAQRHRPVSIRELCTAVGVPERTLHLAFRESYGLPPSQYMKLLRLNSARCALLQADAPVTVSKVAMDWGFLHLGRFAVEYHALFGEPPSETLEHRTAIRMRPEQTIAENAPDDQRPLRIATCTNGNAPRHTKAPAAKLAYGPA